MSEKKTVKVVKAKTKTEPKTTESLFSDEPIEKASQSKTEPVPKVRQSVSKPVRRTTRKNKKELDPKLLRALLIGVALFAVFMMFSIILNNSDNSDSATDTESSTSVQEITAQNNEVSTQQQTDEGKVVWDDENVRITVHSINKAPDMLGSIECPVEVTFFFENKTQRSIGLLLTDSYVNNMKISEYPLPSSTGYCAPGTTGTVKLLFSYNKFGINSYSEIQSVTTSFNVMDENDTSNEFFYETSPVVVNVQLEG